MKINLIAGCGSGFRNNMMTLFKDKNAPTVRMIMKRTFDKLNNTPAYGRAFITTGGLDFGLQALNDAVEPIRLAGLESGRVGSYDRQKGYTS